MAAAVGRVGPVGVRGWIVVGFVGGACGRVLTGSGSRLGCLGTVVVGVVGGLLGGAIFNDEHYRLHFGVTLPQALTVLTTVISRPNPTRVVVDAGRKAMSWDAAIPRALEVPAVQAIKLSAEHCQLELDAPSAIPRIGDRVQVTFEDRGDGALIPQFNRVAAGGRQA